MEYCVNYICDGVLACGQKGEQYIKYPGRMCDIETLEKLYSKNYPIVLHGIIPSSGSILDPHLCDNLDDYCKYVTDTKQKWLSFHFDYRERYNDTNYMQSLEKNLAILRSKFPDIKILIENVPKVSQMQPWYSDPKTFNQILQKYNLKMLLDISHAMVSANYIGISFEQYVSMFDLDRVIEIHFSGTATRQDGKMYDAHFEGNKKDYECFEYAIKKCPNVQMITLEYSPIIETDNNTEVQEVYSKQQEQIEKLKQIYENIKNSEKTQ